MGLLEIVKAAGFESVNEFCEYSGYDARKLRRLLKNEYQTLTAIVKTNAAKKLADIIG